MSKENLLLIIEKIKNGEDVFVSGLQQDELVKLVDIEFLKKYVRLFDIGVIFKNKRLSDFDIRYFVKHIRKRIDYNYLSMFQTVPEDVLSLYKRNMTWNYVTMNQQLSENFIRENLVYLSPDFLPYYQRSLSADFLKRNGLSSSVSWKTISSSFVLDEEFIIEYFEFLDKKLLATNEQAEISERVKLLLKLS
jgi:hypothetical protein